VKWPRIGQIMLKMLFWKTNSYMVAFLIYVYVYVYVYVYEIIYIYGIKIELWQIYSNEKKYKDIKWVLFYILILVDNFFENGSTQSHWYCNLEQLMSNVGGFKIIYWDVAWIQNLIYMDFTINNRYLIDLQLFSRKRIFEGLVLH